MTIERYRSVDHRTARVTGSAHAVHASDDRLSGIYGTIVYEDLGGAGGLRQHIVDPRDDVVPGFVLR